MNLVCGFDIAYENKAKFLCVEVYEISKEENIHIFAKEVSQMDDTLINDCFLICDANLKVLYKNETCIEDDILRAFDFIEKSGLQFDEVQ